MPIWNPSLSHRQKDIDDIAAIELKRPPQPQRRDPARKLRSRRRMVERHMWTHTSDYRLFANGSACGQHSPVRPAVQQLHDLSLEEFSHVEAEDAFAGGTACEQLARGHSPAWLCRSRLAPL